jgi:cytochrome c peroxidase
LPGSVQTEYAEYIGPIADQAYNPFLNPVEQNNPTTQAVCQQVASANYADLFRVVWGEPINCSDAQYPGTGSGTIPVLPYYEINHRRIALSLAAYQMSDQVNSFSCKRDRALQAELACIDNPNSNKRVCNDPDFINSPGTFPLVGLSKIENLGHDLFYNTVPPFGPPIPAPFPDLPVTNCSFCHSDNPGIDDGTEIDQLYTDRAYHSIGIPVNPEIPETGNDPDLGLAGHTGSLTIPFPPFAAAEPEGYFKTPTLRNVCKGTGEGFPKAFGHNGYFKSVEGIVHFYNTADALPECEVENATEAYALKNNCWPLAAYPDTPGIARGPLLGNLGLSAQQEAAIVAYLHTLSDDYTPTDPAPYKEGQRSSDL